MSKDAERFLRVAQEEGALTEAQADDCRRLLAAMGEVQVELGADEIAVRKGFLTQDSVDEIKRALARRRVGKYDILEKLGEGGAGVVWRAHDTKLDRIVALKILSRRMEGTDLYRDRFLREARVAVTLNHVHIVRGLDYGEADGYRFFAMEFVAGESLAQRLEWEGHLAEKDACSITRQVVRALEYVQSFGLVHRDIKPENLLLGASGEVKLGDLGLAKPTLDEWQRATGGVSAGTPLYMAPEQITDPDCVDWRSDVYGLGATLYHALTGQPPFRSDESGSVLHKHVEQEPASPREIVLEISQGAAAVVLKMLRKDPSARYASLDDLAADLEAVIDGRPPIHALTIDSRDSGVFETPVRGVGVPVRVRRRRRVLALVAASAVLLGGGAIVLEHFLGDSPQPRQRRSSAPQTATSTTPGPRAVESTAPDTAPPALTQEERRRRSDARAALDAAHAMRTAEPADLEGAREQYEFVINNHAGQREADEARGLLRLVNEERGQAAAAEFDRRLLAAREAQAVGRLGEAWDLLNSFPARYIDTPSAQDAIKEAAAISEAAAVIVDSALSRADYLLAMNDFADARKTHAAASAAAVPPGAPALAKLLARIENAERDFAELRATERDDYELLVGRVLRAAAGEGTKAALRLRDGHEAGTYRNELARLDHQLDLFETVRRRLEEADEQRPDDAENEPREWPYGLDPENPEDVFGWGLICLARAHRARADKAADRLLELGEGDLAELLRDYERAVVRALRVEVAGLRDSAAERVADGQHRDALPLLQAALRLLPGDKRTHLALGRVSIDLRDLTAAGTAFEHAKPLPEACLELARLHRRRGHLDEAERELTKALENPDMDPVVRREMEELLDLVSEQRKKRLVGELERTLPHLAGEELEEQCRAVLKHDPNHAGALYRLGESLARTHGDHWERIFDAWFVLQRYVEVDPRRDERHRRAKSLLKSLEPFRNWTSEADDLARLGLAQVAEGHFSMAADTCRKALSRSPFLETAHRGLGEALLGPARRLGADRTGLGPSIEAFGRALRMLPEDWDARAGRAEARLLYGDLEGAFADADYALKGDHTLARPALVAGRVLLLRGEAELALLQFQTAHERVPSAAALLWQAEVRIKLGQHHLARGLLDHDLEGKTITDEEQRWIDRLRETLDE